MQAIKRAHHQNFLWVRCTQTNIDPLHLRKNGWNVDSDGNVVPVWYTCSQLSASIKRNPRHYHDHDADVESDGDNNKENYEPPKKRRQRSSARSRSDVESITDLSTGFNENTENSGSEAEDDEWEHISDFLTTSSDSSTSETDWDG